MYRQEHAAAVINPTALLTPTASTMIGIPLLDGPRHGNQWLTPEDAIEERVTVESRVNTDTYCYVLAEMRAIHPDFGHHFVYVYVEMGTQEKHPVSID